MHNNRTPTAKLSYEPTLGLPNTYRLNTRSAEKQYGILFMFSLFGEYGNLEFVSIYAIHRVYTAAGLQTYMLNMLSEEKNTVFYSYLARFLNTVTLNMNMFLSNTGFTRRNTVFRFV